MDKKILKTNVVRSYTSPPNKMDTWIDESSGHLPIKIYKEEEWQPLFKNKRDYVILDIGTLRIDTNILSLDQIGLTKLNRQLQDLFKLENVLENTSVIVAMTTPYSNNKVYSEVISWTNAGSIEAVVSINTKETNIPSTYRLRPGTYVKVDMSECYINYNHVPVPILNKDKEKFITLLNPGQSITIDVIPHLKEPHTYNIIIDNTKTSIAGSLPSYTYVSQPIINLILRVAPNSSTKRIFYNIKIIDSCNIENCTRNYKNNINIVRGSFNQVNKQYCLGPIEFNTIKSNVYYRKETLITADFNFENENSSTLPVIITETSKIYEVI